MNRIMELIKRAQLGGGGDGTEPPIGEEGITPPIARPRKPRKKKPILPVNQPTIDEAESKSLLSVALGVDGNPASQGKAFIEIIEKGGEELNKLKSSLQSNPAGALYVWMQAMKVSSNENRLKVSFSLIEPLEIPIDGLAGVRGSYAQSELLVFVRWIWRQQGTPPAKPANTKDYFLGILGSNRELFDTFVGEMSKSYNYNVSNPVEGYASLINHIVYTKDSERLGLTETDWITLLKKVAPEEMPNFWKHVKTKYKGTGMHEAQKSESFSDIQIKVGITSLNDFKTQPEKFKSFVSAVSGTDNPNVSQYIDTITMYLMSTGKTSVMYSDDEVAGLITSIFSVKDQQSIYAENRGGDISSALSRLPLMSSLKVVKIKSLNQLKTKTDVLPKLLKEYAKWLGQGETIKGTVGVIEEIFSNTEDYDASEIRDLFVKAYTGNDDYLKKLYKEVLKSDSGGKVYDAFDGLPTRITGKAVIDPFLELDEEEKDDNARHKGLLYSSYVVGIPRVPADILHKIAENLRKLVNVKSEGTDATDEKIRQRIFGVPSGLVSSVTHKLTDMLSSQGNHDDKGGVKTFKDLVDTVEVKEVADPDKPKDRTTEVDQKKALQRLLNLFLSTKEVKRNPGGGGDADAINDIRTKLKGKGYKLTKEDVDAFSQLDTSSANKLIGLGLSGIETARDQVNKGKHASLRQIISSVLSHNYLYSLQLDTRPYRFLEDIRRLGVDIKDDEPMTDEKIKSIIDTLNSNLKKTLKHDDKKKENIPINDLKNTVVNRYGIDMSEDDLRNIFGTKENYSTNDILNLSNSLEESANEKDVYGESVSQSPSVVHMYTHDTAEMAFSGIHHPEKDDRRNSTENTIALPPKDEFLHSISIGGGKRYPNHEAVDALYDIVEWKGSTRKKAHSSNPLMIGMAVDRGYKIDNGEGKDERMLAFVELQNDVTKQLGEIDFVVSMVRTARVLSAYIKSKVPALSEEADELSNEVSQNNYLEISKDPDEQKVIERKLRETQYPRGIFKDIISKYNSVLDSLKEKDGNLFNEYKTIEYDVIHGSPNIKFHDFTKGKPERMSDAEYSNIVNKETTIKNRIDTTKKLMLDGISKEESDVLNNRERINKDCYSMVKDKIPLLVRIKARRARSMGARFIAFASAEEAFCEAWGLSNIGSEHDNQMWAANAKGKPWKNSKGKVFIQKPTNVAVETYEGPFLEMGGTIDGDRTTLEFDPENSENLAEYGETNIPMEWFNITKHFVELPTTDTSGKEYKSDPITGKVFKKPVFGKYVFTDEQKRLKDAGRLWVRHHGTDVKHLQIHPTPWSRNSLHKSKPFFNEMFILDIDKIPEEKRKIIEARKKEQGIILQALRTIGEVREGNLYFATPIKDTDGVEKVEVDGTEHTYLTKYFRKL